VSDAPGQVLAEGIVKAMMAKDAFSQWLGIAIVETRPDASTVRLTVREDMVNGFGVSHGGVVFSLADTALAFASNTNGMVTMSIDNAITYPAPAFVGDVLTAVAERESASKRLAFYRVVVRNQHDAVVALFRGTVYRTPTAHYLTSP
jgi:acyl-CoA thioesterase